MGPRLFSRGNKVGRKWFTVREGWLQWGRDSSVAEICLEMTVSWPRFVKLQWGRDSSVAEMTYFVRVMVFSLRASMGPRLFSRGNRGLEGGQRQGPVVASMGPRLFSRGNNQRPERPRLVPAGFNGAATLQSRKFMPRKRGRPRKEASMGPRLFSRGNGLVQFVHGARAFSFNGAATLQPRKCLNKVSKLPGSLSFNGAATLQPRKLRPGVFGRVYKHWLQWGRDSSAAEMPAAFTEGRSGRGCFNGAATLQPRK